MSKSKYHKNCTNSGHNVKRGLKVVSSKNDTSTILNSKVTTLNNAANVADPNRIELDPDLLGHISNGPCSCQVVARAVREDVAHYIGLSNRRASIEKMANAPSNETCSAGHALEENKKLNSRSKVLSQSTLKSQTKVKSQSTIKSVEKKK
ncbi:unnamed protein product [Chrysodeixis includens]|uniref:Uncharacterized protein n=1 Tax=Chrysodeixis includens TaxID=689277 RepID=A0A9N8KXV5_CHRIL|nr:unnamed protein product [Chrysodeixis includens]